MTDTIDIDQPTVFVRFERVVSPEQYGKRQASLSVPVVLTGDPAKDALAIDQATSLAQQVVLDAVGISWETSDGKLVEHPFQAAPSVQKPQTQSGPSYTPQANSGGAAFDVAKWGDPDEVRPCPVCGGETFNNRADKASGKSSPKGPDFKCKAYRNPPKGTNCPGVVWHNETT